jgi:hypothetical protein
MIGERPTDEYWTKAPSGGRAGSLVRRAGHERLLVCEAAGRDRRQLDIEIENGRRGCSS